MGRSVKLLNQLGISSEDQRFEEKLPLERAHYSLQTFDQQVKLDRWGWTEISGFAHRSDYDLRSHHQFSGVDMRVFKGYEEPEEKVIRTAHPVVAEIRKLFKEHAQQIIKKIPKLSIEEIQKLSEDGFIKINGFKVPVKCIQVKIKTVKETGDRFIPHVVEPSFGAERLFYAVLEKSYTVKEGRVVLKIPKPLSPYDAAVFPLVSKDKLDSYSMKIFQQLTSNGFDVFYDDKGSIGRRYARADEAGIPAALTVDYQTIEDDTITVRDRDTWNQVRVDIKDIEKFLTDLVKLT